LSETRSDHAVVVLAAGASTRLGQPKQLLRRAGETLLHRMVRLARGTAPTTLVVVLPPSPGALAEALEDLDYVLATNPAPQRGMAGSLHAATPSVKAAAHVLVIGCDQPALEAAHLDALLVAARQAASGCAATALDATLGIPAVVPGHWFAERAAGRDDSGFRARLRAVDRASVGVLQAPGLALDIDTPEDLLTARGRGLIDP
jgi:molybdenum cofactor cytidylyltransferase